MSLSFSLRQLLASAVFAVFLRMGCLFRACPSLALGFRPFFAMRPRFSTRVLWHVPCVCFLSLSFSSSFVRVHVLIFPLFPFLSFRFDFVAISFRLLFAGFGFVASQSLLAGSNFRIEGSAFVRKLSKLKHRHYMVELVRLTKEGERPRETVHVFGTAGRMCQEEATHAGLDLLLTRCNAFRGYIATTAIEVAFWLLLLRHVLIGRECVLYEIWVCFVDRCKNYRRPVVCAIGGRITHSLRTRVLKEGSGFRSHS